MGTATLISIDLGKLYFFLHAQDHQGHEVWRKKAARATLGRAGQLRGQHGRDGSLHGRTLARKLQALGHQLRLIAPQFVRPFVKGNNTDFADAEAICEAAACPAMRFVAVKTPEQQTLLALLRVREALVLVRTAAANQIHGFLIEFGVRLFEDCRARLLIEGRARSAPIASPDTFAQVSSQVRGQGCEDQADHTFFVEVGQGNLRFIRSRLNHAC